MADAPLQEPDTEPSQDHPLGGAALPGVHVPEGSRHRPAALEMGIGPTILSQALSLVFDWWLALAFATMYLQRIEGRKADRPTPKPIAG